MQYICLKLYRFVHKHPRINCHERLIFQDKKYDTYEHVLQL